MVLDPVAYATPGPDYNSVGVVGPQPNPFWFDPTQVAATIDHYGQWGTTTSQTGAFVFGSFTAPINTGIEETVPLSPHGAAPNVTSST